MDVKQTAGTGGKKHVYLAEYIMSSYNTDYGEAVKKRSEKSVARGISKEFIRDVCVKPKIKYYDEERPYFYVDFSGTSRVDMDFVKAHKQDFYRQTLFHLNANKSFIRIGIPENYWCVERFTFLCDKTIELVIGLKPELFEGEKTGK